MTRGIGIIVSVGLLLLGTARDSGGLATEIFHATFESSEDGFAFRDDTFRGTSAPRYSSGSYLPSGGSDGDGALQVKLGGLDTVDIYGMSGGWERGFDLEAPSRLTLSLRYMLTQTAHYERSEFSEVLVSIDQSLVGDAVDTIVGNGNRGPPLSTEWQTAVVDLGIWTSGSHVLTVGGYNNRKTYNNEATEVMLDEITLFRSSGSMDVVLEADFDSDVGSFSYLDDAFGTSEPAYASGAYLPTGGRQGGGLQVTLGGVNNVDVYGMSGAWQSSFVVPTTGSVTVSFEYRLVQAGNYERDEFTQVICSVDGTRDYVAQITGNGNGGGSQIEGWAMETLNVGTLSAGPHTLALGGYSNKKTFADEESAINIDNVWVGVVSDSAPQPTGAPAPTSAPAPTAPIPPSPPTSTDIILEADFDGGSNDFEYVKDAFRGTNQPSYSSGTRLDTGGFSGGALAVELGGVDGADVFGMSGGWKDSFTLTEPTSLTLSFRYQLIQTPYYESDELSQALASVDGTLVGQAPFDRLATIVGDGNFGGDQSTGWKLFEADLGTLSAGDHVLVLGGFNSKKTVDNEVTTVLFDDVMIKVDKEAGDPTSGAQNATSRLNLDNFKDNIKTLASFGDRTQGSSSYANAEGWVRSEMEKLGYVVETHKYRYRGEPRENMYVTKVGTKFPDRMFIVSAHLDGRGGGGAADDDGSGCSLVMEIARVLASSDITTAVSIRMIWWNTEETGLNGSFAYRRDRRSLQGRESLPGVFPEPTWLGIVQHDMILFDHGLPPQANQIRDADADIEYRAASVFSEESRLFANALKDGSYGKFYPAQVTGDMCCTDSVPFQDIAPAISIRENRRRAEIGNGANPQYHQPTDVFASYGDEDFVFAFNIVQITLGSIGQFAGLKIV